MEIKLKVTANYTSSLERAFKTPLLCDVSKIHTGYGLMPRITHCTDDHSWGQVNSSKKIHAATSLFHKGGFASVDTILQRIENNYWEFMVHDFQSPMLGFTKFVGGWKTTAIKPGNVLVEYTYILHAGSPLLYPLNWLFAHTFWKLYMKRILKIVEQLALNNEPYKHN